MWTTMMTRRNCIKGVLTAGVGSSLTMTASGSHAQPMRARSRVLVAYFTRSGNTKLIAAKVRRDIGADLFQIQPAEPYPEDYEATVAQAERERLAGFEPPLKENVAEIGAYSTVYLGFPIWGSTAPTVIKSFLAKHDLSGKDLVPLITHGGYGAGDILAVLRRMAPKARVYKPFVIRMDQERAILKELADWMQSSDAPR
jgi:flavodoxin